MKYFFLCLFLLSSLTTFSQNASSWTEYDTLTNDTGLTVIKVSTYRDSSFFSSFKTTISDTTVKIERGGFLWTKKYKIEIHVFGPKWDYKYGENSKNIRICTEPYGVSFISRYEE